MFGIFGRLSLGMLICGVLKVGIFGRLIFGRADEAARDAKLAAFDRFGTFGRLTLGS